LAHAFLWEYSEKGLELAQLLGQLAIFLTWLGWRVAARSPAGSGRLKKLTLST
jgi:hypothetical protein